MQGRPVGLPNVACRHEFIRAKGTVKTVPTTKRRDVMFMKQKKTGSKGIRELLLPFLLLLFIAITASCGGGGGGGVPSGGSGGATLSSIAVTPANPSIAVGATQQFTATGTYSDSSTQNVTSSATWSSSDTTRATINASGLATAVAAGPTTITATSGNISGNTLLTVNIVVGSSVNLPETGQTTCYDTAGTAIACAGTGQDGELLKGVAWPSPRFMDNGNGTVTDNLTGLIWLKDANCFISRTWADALLDASVLSLTLLYI